MRGGEKQEGITKDESVKALLCWRNTAEKQELEVIFLNFSYFCFLFGIQDCCRKTLTDNKKYFILFTQCSLILHENKNFTLYILTRSFLYISFAIFI